MVEGFGYLSHNIYLEKPGLGADGAHLSENRKNIFGQKLSSLVRRALN